MFNECDSQTSKHKITLDRMTQSINHRTTYSYENFKNQLHIYLNFSLIRFVLIAVFTTEPQMTKIKPSH